MKNNALITAAIVICLTSMLLFCAQEIWLLNLFQVLGGQRIDIKIDSNYSFESKKIWGIINKLLETLLFVLQK